MWKGRENHDNTTPPSGTSAQARVESVHVGEGRAKRREPRHWAWKQGNRGQGQILKGNAVKRAEMKARCTLRTVMQKAAVRPPCGCAAAG